MMETKEVAGPQNTEFGLRNEEKNKLGSDQSNRLKI